MAYAARKHINLHILMRVENQDVFCSSITLVSLQPKKEIVTFNSLPLSIHHVLQTTSIETLEAQAWAYCSGVLCVYTVANVKERQNPKTMQLALTLKELKFVSGDWAVSRLPMSAIHRIEVLQIHSVYLGFVLWVFCKVCYQISSCVHCLDLDLKLSKYG